MSAADWLGAVAGSVGGIAGVGGAVVAVLARQDSRRSADASERSAHSAAALTRIEGAREHQTLRPTPPPQIEPVGREGSLFGTIFVPNDYRVAATRIMSQGSSADICMPLLIRANQPCEFFIEEMPPDRAKPQTREIIFRFWPPTPTDDVAPWSCPCDEPISQDQGHWEWRVPVTWARPNLRFM